MQLLKPDYTISDFLILTNKWLADRNVRYIFSDLDNTLVAHGETGPKKLDAWLKQLDEAGITLIGTSNNNYERAERFRTRHGVKVIENCGKPRTKVLNDYIQQHNIDKGKTIFMGDQIFVDILCGNRLNITTVLVQPIKGNTPLSVQTTWLFDRSFIRFRKWKKKVD